MVGDTLQAATCYLYSKTAGEIAVDTAAKREIVVEKATKIQHYMVAFTAKMGHMQISADSLEETSKAKAL